MRTHVLHVLRAILLIGAIVTAQSNAHADDNIKTVYHLQDDRVATLAMNNIANHVSADPGVKIVVVALSTGVRAFTFGAQDAGGRPYAEWVEQLKAKGVEFTKEPTREFYGFEALFKDDSGNWFSLGEKEK